jgi:hypothetical protein
MLMLLTLLFFSLLSSSAVKLIPLYMSGGHLPPALSALYTEILP